MKKGLFPPVLAALLLISALSSWGSSSSAGAVEDTADSPAGKALSMQAVGQRHHHALQ